MGFLGQVRHALLSSGSTMWVRSLLVMYKRAQNGGLQESSQSQRSSGSTITSQSTYRTSVAELSHPPEESHFSQLYPQSLPFCQYPKLLTIGESRNVDALAKSYAVEQQSIHLSIYTGPVHAEGNNNTATRSSHCKITERLPT